MAFWTPTSAEIGQAVGIYTGLAYGEAALPAAVRQRLTEFRARAAGGQDWDCAAVEKSASPERYALRLGNPWYPHMKLAVERSPDGEGYLLRVDTHDRHIRPSPQSPDYPAFCVLQDRNLRLAETIEAAWATSGLMTFKEYLRRDLERRCP